MAKLVTKFKYLKPTDKLSPGGYAKYIATREGVEKIDESFKLKPVTVNQKQLIAKMLRDFPDSKNSLEYDDYLQNKTVGAASEFISRTMEENAAQMMTSKTYADYIATRPRAERFGSHGLFTDDGVAVNLSKVSEELNLYEGNVWTAIISLRREDAERLGYNNGERWRDMLRTQTEALSTNLNIPMQNLKWFAAFHNESHHPHVHLIAYSAVKGQGYLTQKGVMNLRSSFAKDIFAQDLISIYEKQTEHRDELKANSREVIAEIISKINSGAYNNPKLEEMLLRLVDRLSKTSGKKVYGYLKADVKAIVNSIVDELAADERIAALYDLWYEQRDAITGTYQDTPEQRIPLSQNKEFKAVKNAVIQESLNILYDRITFEEAVSDPEIFTPDEQEEPSTESSASEKWWNDHGNPIYQYRKAKEYLDRDNPRYDPTEAVRWLEQSADQGYEYAQYRLGKLYLTGKEVEQNIEYGLYRAWQAEQQNNPFAQYLLGKTYLNGELVEQDLPQAEQLFEKASDQGNSYAKYSLAKMYLAGLATENDMQKAVRLLRESAEGGNEWAQYLLGKFCFRGEHTEKNLLEAERLLTASANQENSQAQYLLARLYLSEDGLPKDAEKAVYWLYKSAEQENQYAQYQLGKMLLFGKDADQDIENGIALLTASAEQGNPYAVRLLQGYYSGRLRNPSVGMASFRLLAQLARMFENRLRKNEDGQRMQIDRKLRRQIEEKKQLHGLKMG